MLNRASYYPADVGRTLLKGTQRVSIEFPDLHYNRATVLKYLEEYCPLLLLPPLPPPSPRITLRPQVQRCHPGVQARRGY
jgi:hypothetical protein